MRRLLIRVVVAAILLQVAVQLAAFLARQRFGPADDEGADEFGIVTIMNGTRYRGRALALRGGSVRTIMGGTELDLRDAQLAPGGARVEVLTVAGATEIRVPAAWRVEVRGDPRGGEHDVNVTSERDVREDAPHLVIEARTFGGALEVKAASDEPQTEAGTV